MNQFSTLRHAVADGWQRYRRGLSQDLIAGISGAAAGAPLAMGFAIIAGVSPIYGLYTGAVATLVAALTTSSVFMTVGTTNALALVVGSTLSPHTGTGLLERLFVLTLLVGVFQLAFGVLRFGNLARYVSNAVMTGFVTGAGLLIIIGQLPNLTGYESGGAQRALPKLWYWFNHLHQTNFETLVTGVAAIAIIVALQQTRLKRLATLTALAFTALVVWLLAWNDVMLVRDISEVPSGLPALTIPTWEHVPDLAVPALALAVLATVQGAAIANAVPQPDDSTPNVSRDMLGQGFANIAGSFFQCMPAGGSLSRTAVNVSAGAQTRLANAFAGLSVALVLLLFSGTIEYIALAALAGQLIVAAVSLIQPEQIRIVWRVHWSARAAMVATFAATLLLPLEYSIYIGVVLSVVLYMQTSSSAIKIARLVSEPGHRFRETPVGNGLPTDGTVIFTIAGDLYFAAVRYLEEQLPSPAESKNTTVILRLRDVQYVGSTAIRFLQRYDRLLREHGGKLILAGVSSPIKEQFKRAGMFEYLGKENIFLADEVVFSALEHALEHTSPQKNTSEV